MLICYHLKNYSLISILLYAFQTAVHKSHKSLILLYYFLISIDKGERHSTEGPYGAGNGCFHRCWLCGGDL